VIWIAAGFKSHTLSDPMAERLHTNLRLLFVAVACVRYEWRF